MADEAQGAIERQQLIDGGYSQEEVSSWEQDQRRALAEGGFGADDISGYFADPPPPDLGPFKEQFEVAFQDLTPEERIHVADNPMEALKAGWQASATGLVARGAAPDTGTGPNAGVGYKILEGVGMLGGDLPFMVYGAVTGAAVGTGVAGPPGTIIGAGAGGAMVPAAVRRTLMDAYTNGEFTTWDDFYARGTEVLWGTVKETIVGAVSAKIGNVISGRVGAVTGSRVAAGGADVTSMALSATALHGALEGHIPDADDFMVGAVLAVGFHAAVTITGATKRATPTAQGEAIASNLRDIYARYGIPPNQAVTIAKNDPVLRGEIFAPRNADGEAVTPTLDAMKPQEPPAYKPYKPVIDGKTIDKVTDDLAKKLEEAPREVAAEDATPAQTDNYLNLFRQLERSGDDAVSPAGAIGRYQIMPGTAVQYGFDPLLLKDVGYNERVARTILTDLHQRYKGDVAAMAVAYNAGPGRADRWIKGGRKFESLPTETQRYLQHAERIGAFSEGMNAFQVNRTLDLVYGKSDWMPKSEFAEGLVSNPRWVFDLPDMTSEVLPSGRVVPGSEFIGTYLEEFGRQAGFKFQVGPATSMSAGFINPQRETGPQYHQEKKIIAKDGTAVFDAAHVYLPKNTEAQNRAWYGLGTSEILFHEIGHALDYKLGFRKTTMVAGDLAKEIEAVSRQFRPLLWTRNPTYNLKPSELMADAVAVWLSNPSMREKMPLFKERFGFQLEKYVEIAERALPKKGKGGRWDHPPGAEDPPPPGSGEEAPPPKGGKGGGKEPPGPPKLPPDWINAPPPGNKKVETSALSMNESGIIAYTMQHIVKPEKPGIIPDWVRDPRKIWAAFQSQLSPTARRLDKKWGVDPKELGIEDMMRQIYGTASQVQHFLDVGTLKFDLRPDGFWGYTKGSDASYQSALKAVKDDGGTIEGYWTWRFLSRAIEKENQGIDVGLRTDVARRYLNMRSVKAKYERAAKIHTEVKDALIEWVYDAGRFTRAQADRLKEMNREHVVMRRVLDPTYNPKRVGEGTGTIRKMKGSERDYIDPATSEVDNMSILIMMGNVNRALGNIIGLAEKLNPKGQKDNLIPLFRDDGKTQLLLTYEKGIEGELLGPDGKPFKGEDGQGMTRKSQEGAKALLAERAMRSQLGPDDFLFFRNGKPEVWTARDPDLAALIRSPAVGPLDVIPGILAAVADFQRAGIASDPAFAWRSMTYGQIAASVAGDGGAKMPFHDLFRGIFVKAFGLKDVYNDWIANGGANSTIAYVNKNYIDSHVQRIFEQTGTWDAVRNTVRHPIQALLSLSHQMDSAARLGAFHRLKAKGVNPLKASMQSRTLYLDHAERQTAQWVNTWARVTPFMATAIKDFEQVAQAIRNRPWSTLGAGAAVLTAPTVINYALNLLADEGLPEKERYHNMRRWERDLYWVLPPNGAGVRQRIRKPPSVTSFMFSTVPERFLDFLTGNDPGWYKGVLKTLQAETVPPYIPSFATPILEDAFNTDIQTMRPLVPAYLEDAHGDMQYKPDTSITARKLASAIGVHGWNLVDASPIVIQNYARELAGTLPMTLLKVFEMPFKPVGRPKEYSDTPFLGSFFVRSTGAGQTLDDYFDSYQDLVSSRADLRIAKQRLDEDEIGMVLGDPLSTVRLSELHKGIMTSLAAIRIYENDKDMTDDEKRKYVDDLATGIYAMAKSGLEVLGEIKSSTAPPVDPSEVAE